MARLIGPDEASRTVFLTSGANKGKAAAQGMSVPLYADLALSTAADVLSTTDGVIAGTPPTLTVDAYSQIPLFKYPDGVDIVYTSINGGPPVALYARADERLDALAASVGELEAGVDGAETPAGAQGKVDAHAADTTNVHGIADTAVLETQTGSQTKASTAQAAAVQRVNHTGTQSADTLTDGTTNKAFLATERTKLTGVATGATANSTDAQLRDRSTHTGAQATSTVTGLDAALAAKADLVGGLVPSAQIPAIAISEFLGAVSSQAAMLALSGQKGDWAARTDGAGSTWIISGTDPTQIGSWTQIVSPADAVSSVAGRAGVVVLAKADVGLSGVDNTSDENKPVSTATATALAAKARYADLPVIVTDPTYGADKTGVANSSAAFAAAIAAAGATRTVYVPAGTYKVDPDVIVLIEGAAIKGEHYTNTTILSTTSKTGIGVTIAGSSAEVSGLFIRGYYAGIDNAFWFTKIYENKLSYNTIGIDYSNNSYITKTRGNEITFNDVGVYFRPGTQSYEANLTDNIIDNNNGVGCALANSSGGIILENNTIEGNRKYTTNIGCGILVKGSNLSRLKINGNWFEANGTHDTYAVDVFMLAPGTESVTGAALRTQIVAVLPAGLQPSFATGGCVIGAVSITENAFVFTKYGVVVSGDKVVAAVERNSFKGVKDRFNKHIFLNVPTGSYGIGGSRVTINQNSWRNSDDATIDPQVSTGINGTIVYSDSTLTTSTDEFVYNGKDLFHPLPQITTFPYTGSTVTYAIPPWAKTLVIEAVAGGGGPGSGRRGASGTVCGGGGGGGGGAFNRVILPAAGLAGPLRVTVGAAGTPGAAVTTNDTNGNAGTAGGATLIMDTSSTIVYLQVTGGSAGQGGTTTGGSAGGGGVGGSPGGSGGAGGTGAVGANATVGASGAGGGAGGGGISAAPAAFAGGLGAYSTNGSSLSQTAAGANGASRAPTTFAGTGSGGGGGAASTSGAGSPGGNGGTYGAGGGGGGAALNDSNSGAGGTPAPGYVTITAT